MKTIFNLILTLLPITLLCQNEIDNVNNEEINSHAQVTLLLDSAKFEFNIDYLDQDYDKSIRFLEKALLIEPNNTEVLYYLGYAYSRKNSKDAKQLVDIDYNLVKKSSEQFEKINKISPKYDKEILIQDPYSKITSEWGSLGLKYLYNHKPDSALWAFKEGKKRGGFDGYIMKLNKEILKQCSKNAILITSGDNCTFPLLYLQNIDNYRKDVSVVNIDLLGTNWYTRYLSDNKIVTFDIEQSKINDLEYIEWQDSLITINNLSWVVKPVHYDTYLWRSNFLLLSMLKENKFVRDVYFCMGISNSSKLNLEEHIERLGVVEKIKTNKTEAYPFSEYKKNVSYVIKHSKSIDYNKPDEAFFLNIFRYNVWLKVMDLLNEDELSNAKELASILEDETPEEEYPYGSLQNIVNSIRWRLIHTN